MPSVSAVRTRLFCHETAYGEASLKDLAPPAQGYRNPYSGGKLVVNTTTVPTATTNTRPAWWIIRSTGAYRYTTFTTNLNLAGSLVACWPNRQSVEELHLHPVVNSIRAASRPPQPFAL